MAGSLTPQDAELHVRDLRDRLRDYLERREGRLAELHRDAEAVFGLREQFPDVFDRYPELEGMVAEMLAREQQQRVFGTGQAREAPGCLAGWLLGRRR